MSSRVLPLSEVVAANITVYNLRVRGDFYCTVLYAILRLAQRHHTVRAAR